MRQLDGDWLPRPKWPLATLRSQRRCGFFPGQASRLATNKSLALSNKSYTRAEATEKRTMDGYE
jgi:hypothetical protein